MDSADALRVLRCQRRGGRHSIAAMGRDRLLVALEAPFNTSVRPLLCSIAFILIDDSRPAGAVGPSDEKDTAAHGEMLCEEYEEFGPYDNSPVFKWVQSPSRNEILFFEKILIKIVVHRLFPSSWYQHAVPYMQGST